jgi:hypothetical protein
VSNGERSAASPGAKTLDELARSCSGTPIGNASELAADIWASDEELDAFLDDLRASRGQSLA